MQMKVFGIAHGKSQNLIFIKQAWVNRLSIALMMFGFHLGYKYSWSSW